MPALDIQKADEQRLSRLGIIRLGIKVPGRTPDKSYPKEADHFVLTDAPDVAAVYGDKPQSLLVYLPFPTVDENLIAYHELWAAGYCKCRGDANRIVDLLDPAGVERIVRDGLVLKDFNAEGDSFRVGDVMPCPGLAHNRYKRCLKCRPSAVLMVMVRSPHDETQLVADRLGYYQIRTNSFHNIHNLTAQLRYAEKVARQWNGSLQGIPLILKRVQRDISYVNTDTASGEQRRQTGPKWLLDVEFDLVWVHRATERMRALALGDGLSPMPMLDAGLNEVVDGEAEVGE